jgi:hypothetical protein
MNLEELKTLPMIKAHQTKIEFELSEENIENYRDIYDDTTVITLHVPDEDYSEVWAGDLCDMLYQVMEVIEENEFEDCVIYYCDKWETKNFEGDDIDLLCAAAESYASADERSAEEYDKAIVCFEDDTCFVMENNYWDDDISQKDFDTLWNV